MNHVYVAIYNDLNKALLEAFFTIKQALKNKRSLGGCYHLQAFGKPNRMSSVGIITT